MANTVQFDDGSIVEYDIRVPKREELQRVIDLVNADDWNMSVDILTDIYDVQTDGFRVAVDKQGNILGKHVQNLFQPFFCNRAFHKLDEIGNDANVGTRGFTI